MHKQTSSLTSISLAEREPEEQELELPMMLDARKRAASLFSEDDLPSPSALSASARRTEPVRIWLRVYVTTTVQHLLPADQCCASCTCSHVCFLLQQADNRGFFTKLLHFCIGNWEKALVLGIIITLIVLVSVKVSSFSSAQNVKACRGWLTCM